MEDYDEVVIAGDEPYWLSGCLYDLARHVGIPAPHFYGKREYHDYNGAEKWQITTLIQGRTADPFDLDMEYTGPYPDFEFSVGMAMHGAISRICGKYRAYIDHGSVFRLFGERSEPGDTIDRGHQQLTPTRYHFMEREFVATNSEVLMMRQIAVIDSQRERIKRMERTILKMDDHNGELSGKLEDKEALLLATQAQCSYFATEFNQIGQVREDRDKLQKEVDELQKKLAQMSVVQKEAELVVPPAPAEAEAPAAEEDEEEDPEEREFENSSDDDASTEESSTGSSNPPKKRMRATQYVKLFKIQP